MVDDYSWSVSLALALGYLVIIGAAGVWGGLWWLTAICVLLGAVDGLALWRYRRTTVRRARHAAVLVCIAALERDLLSPAGLILPLEDWLAKNGIHTAPRICSPGVDDCHDGRGNSGSMTMLQWVARCRKTNPVAGCAKDVRLPVSSTDR